MFYESEPASVFPPLQPLWLFSTIELYTRPGTTDALDFANIHRLRTLSYGADWCFMVYADSPRSAHLIEVMRTLGFAFRVVWPESDPVFKVEQDAKNFLHAQDLLFSSAIFKRAFPTFNPRLPYAPSATWLTDYLVRLRTSGSIFTPQAYLNEMNKVVAV
jgi:hypothetical protein